MKNVILCASLCALLGVGSAAIAATQATDSLSVTKSALVKLVSDDAAATNSAQSADQSTDNSGDQSTDGSQGQQPDQNSNDDNSQPPSDSDTDND